MRVPLLSRDALNWRRHKTLIDGMGFGFPQLASTMTQALANDPRVFQRDFLFYPYDKDPVIQVHPAREANRLSAIVGSLVFFLIAPGTVAGFVPWMISHWHMQVSLLHFPAFRVIGTALIAGGGSVLLDSFARFALQGLGTPAPILPTKHLVVSGLYRHVRNPMYLGVVGVILGQGLLLGNVRVLAYGAIVWSCFQLFVLGYEEPKLRRNFGPRYELFCASVPRWFPRRSPWRGLDAP
jgi:protein-S-isoprenylcysteine O-methyltransferase Ste14